MKFLISSKYLAKKLMELEGETVQRLALNGNELTVIAENKSVKIEVHVLRFQPALRQENRRWDWVLNDVKAISEQPIVLDIYENVINVILQH